MVVFVPAVCGGGCVLFIAALAGGVNLFVVDEINDTGAADGISDVQLD